MTYDKRPVIPPYEKVSNPSMMNKKIRLSKGGKGAIL